jgi:hypothetical protein
MSGRESKIGPTISIALGALLGGGTGDTVGDGEGTPKITILLYQTVLRFKPVVAPARNPPTGTSRCQLKRDAASGEEAVSAVSKFTKDELANPKPFPE